MQCEHGAASSTLLSTTHRITQRHTARPSPPQQTAAAAVSGAVCRRTATPSHTGESLSCTPTAASRPPATTTAAASARRCRLLLLPRGLAERQRRGHPQAPRQAAPVGRASPAAGSSGAASPRSGTTRLTEAQQQPGDGGGGGGVALVAPRQHTRAAQCSTHGGGVSAIGSAVGEPRAPPVVRTK